MPKNISQLVTPFTGIDPAADLVAMWDASAGKTVPAPVRELSVPTGTVVAFAGATAPAGWLLCAGQSVLKATYAALWAVIGGTYGSSDATHFTLPDLRGRVPAGPDNMGGTDAHRLDQGFIDDGDPHAIGSSMGNQSRVLTAENLPPHQHDVWVGSEPAEGGAGGALPATGNEGAFQSGEGNGALEAFSLMQPTLILNYLIKV